MTRTIKQILKDKPGRVWTLAPAHTVQTALDRLAEHRIGALPVCDPAGRVIGIFSERDFVLASARTKSDVRDRPVGDLMVAPVVCVSKDDTAEGCMALMTDRRVRHLPVVEEGKLVGIVSIGDLVRAVLEKKAVLIDELERYITDNRAPRSPTVPLPVAN